MFSLAYSCCHPSICIFASLSSSSTSSAIVSFQNVKFCAMFSSSTKTPEQRNLVHVAAFSDMEVLSIISLGRHFFFLSLLFLGSLCTDPLPPPSLSKKSEKGPLLRFLLRGGGILSVHGLFLGSRVLDFHFFPFFCI